MADESPSYRDPERVERLRVLRAENARLVAVLSTLEQTASRRERRQWGGFLLGVSPLIVLPFVLGLYQIASVEERVDPHHVECPGVGYVDTENDESHCGRCDRRCERSDLVCRFGVCECPSGSLDHGGACVDLDSDSAHCGSLANACAPGVACVSGQCWCEDGLSSCLGRDGLTHCVDYAEDEAHCGDCQLECGRGATCHDGTCACDDPALVHCFPNQSYFGACVNTQTDPYHCGACDHFCETGDPPSCVNGACVVDRH